MAQFRPVFLLELMVSCWLLCCRGDEPAGVACAAPKGNNVSCVCQHPQGVIDLTPLANKDGTARFKGIQGPDYKYDYNPCYPFTSEDDCIKAHMCRNIDGYDYLVANATEQIYMDKEEGTYIYYQTRWQQTIYSLRVYMKLLCDNSLPTGQAKITTTGEDLNHPLHFNFTLKSCHACPGGCT